MEKTYFYVDTDGLLLFLSNPIEKKSLVRNLSTWHGSISWTNFYMSPEISRNSIYTVACNDDTNCFIFLAFPGTPLTW